MDNTINSKVEQIRSFFKKAQPDNHPIVNHPLSQCEEYVKGLYFDMLCVMAQYENEDVENQNRFIQRIMAGCNETMTISEHIKRAMEISVDKVTEFVKQCNDNNLKEIFFIDSLIICCANGTPNRKQVDFLAEIGDVFGYDKISVKFMGELVIAVLEQDFEKLKECVNNYEDIEKELAAANCYIQPIIDENVVSSNDNLIYYSLLFCNEPLFDGITEYDAKGMFGDYVKIKHKDSVTIENHIINKPVIYNSVKRVVLKGCEIRDVSRFDCVENVVIENCFFSMDLTGRIWSEVFYFYNGDCNVEISNSRFINCHNNSTTSTIIGSQNNNCVKIESCEFIECSSGFSGSIISTSNNLEVNNCVFINCKNGNRLFSCGPYTGDNNKFIGCCRER